MAETARALLRSGRLAACAALAAALLAPACAHPPEAPAPGGLEAPAADAPAAALAVTARPPFYRVAGGSGASLLLLGTIHVGPAEGWRLAPAIEAGIASADRVALEVDLRLATEDAVSSLMAELVLLGAGESLPTQVAPETAKLLDEEDAALARLGFPAGMRNRMKPWFVAVGLAESVYAEAGLTGEAATERVILAGLGERPLVGLETFEEQLRFLDGLPPDLADLMLRDTLARLDTAQAEVRELLAAWSAGDEAALARLAREGADALPGLDRFYDRLLGERNRRWLAQLAPLVDDPAHSGETVLVAVGALHLVGDDSLVALLRAAGHRVEAVAR